MKYKYFKFTNPPVSCNVFIARVEEGSSHCEYKAIKREKNIFFSWDDDWLEYILKNESDAIRVLEVLDEFTEMDEDDVFEELL